MFPSRSRLVPGVARRSFLKRSTVRVALVPIIVFGVVAVCALSTLSLSTSDNIPMGENAAASASASSSSIKLETLDDADDIFAAVAGVYRDESLRRKYGTDRTILVASSNSGMSTFLENWMCHANRLGYKYLVHTLDEDLYNDMESRGVHSFVTRNIDKGFAGFGKGHYYNIVKAKLDIVILALSKGYDVFFSDVDIGFYNDAFPLFKRDCDFEFQTAEFLKNGVGSRGPNHGFYYAKSNDRTISFLRDIRDDPRKSGTQTIGAKHQHNRGIHMLLPNEEKRSDKNWRIVDPLRVIVGNSVMHGRKFFLDALTKNGVAFDDLGTVHACFVTGDKDKFAMLRYTGLWLWDKDDGCRAFDIEVAAKKTEDYLKRADVWPADADTTSWAAFNYTFDIQ